MDEDLGGELVERSIGPLTRNLESLDMREERQGVIAPEFAPRGQGKLWDPPMSTRPKRWYNPAKRDTTKKSSRGGRRVPRWVYEQARENWAAAGDSFPQKLAVLDDVYFWENLSKDRIREWLNNLDTLPPPAMNRPETSSRTGNTRF